MSVANKGVVTIPFTPTAGCRICSGTGYWRSTAGNIVCRNCKYGGDTCMRNGTTGECCDLPAKHSGPHLDREKFFTWYGGYGGLDTKYDNLPPEKPQPADQAKMACSCSLASIWTKGCSCGGD